MNRYTLSLVVGASLLTTTTGTSRAQSPHQVGGQHATKGWPAATSVHHSGGTTGVQTTKTAPSGGGYKAGVSSGTNGIVAKG